MTSQLLGRISFLPLTFGIAWVLWVLILRHVVSPNTTQFQLGILPGVFTPAAAALIVRVFVTREGLTLSEFVPRLNEWPVYLLGWFFSRTGDVWSVALAHMASNTIGGSAPMRLLPGD